MAKISKRTWKTATGDARTAWRCDFTDASGHRQRKQFSTRREADAFRIKIEGEVRAGTYRADASRITVGEVCDEYLEHVRGRSRRGERFSRRHLEMVEGRIGNYIATDPGRAARRKGKSRVTLFTGGIGHVRLSQLTPAAVDDFRDRLRSAGVSVATTRKIIGTLGAVFAFAVRRNFIAVNPARGVEVIGRRDEGSRKVVAPSAADVRALLALADPDMRLRMIFAAASGLRAGEQWALRWRHLDLARGEVTVETRVDAHNSEDAPKSSAGVRTLPLAPDVVAMLRQWKLRSRWSRPDDLVFPNREGSYVRHTHLIKRFNALFDRPGAPMKFNWHSLRHHAVSSWIAAGLAPKTVQTFAGHSTLALTMDTYGSLFKSEDHAAAIEQAARGLFT